MGSLFELNLSMDYLTAKNAETQKKTAANAPDGLLDFASSIGPEDFQFQFFFVLFASLWLKQKKRLRTLLMDCLLLSVRSVRKIPIQFFFVLFAFLWLKQRKQL